MVESLEISYSALLSQTIGTLPMNQHFLVKCKQYFRINFFIVFLVHLHKTGIS